MSFKLADLEEDNELIGAINALIQQGGDPAAVVAKCGLLQEKLLQQDRLIAEQLLAMDSDTHLKQEARNEIAEKEKDQIPIDEIPIDEILIDRTASETVLSKSDTINGTSLLHTASHPIKSDSQLITGGSSVPEPSEGPIANGSEVVANLCIEKVQNWILANVLGFTGNVYMIEDAEVDESTNTKTKYSISPHQLVPLVSGRREFPAGSEVIALFPGSTCFYRAKVVLPPSKRKKTLDYLVEFEDDFVDGILVKRNIPSKYVVKPF